METDLLNLRTHYEEMQSNHYFNFNFKSLSGQVVPIGYYKDFFVSLDDQYMFTAFIHIVIIINFFGLMPVNTFQI